MVKEKFNGTTYTRCKKCSVLVVWGEMKDHKKRCNPKEIEKLNRIMQESARTVNKIVNSI